MSKWIVDGLIPMGHAVLLLGQPHSCKSWLAEQLAVCVAAGRTFLCAEGFAITPGSVLLIDEDTPTDTLEERLDRLCSAYNLVKSDLPLTYLSMEGIMLDNDAQMQKLIDRINGMKPPVLVILDSLSSLMGGWNENNTKDAVKAALTWKELKKTGATVIIIHHMSLKKKGSYKEFDFTGKAMGNTQLIAKCDTAIGMWRIPPEVPTCAVVKTKPRRTALTVTEPFAICLKEAEDKSWALLTISEEIPSEPSEVVRSIFPLFYQDGLELYTSEVIEKVKKDYSEKDIREALHELEKEEALIRDTEKGREHRYKYKLNSDFVNPYWLTTGYWDELR